MTSVRVKKMFGSLRHCEPSLGVNVLNVTTWHGTLKLFLLFHYKFGSLRISVSSPLPSTNAQLLKQRASEYNIDSLIKTMDSLKDSHN